MPVNYSHGEGQKVMNMIRGPRVHARVAPRARKIVSAKRISFESILNLFPHALVGVFCFSLFLLGCGGRTILGGRKEALHDLIWKLFVNGLLSATFVILACESVW
ncbi:hypothetical protein BDV27DRAFT_131087 [Aspergillus caelatus]|uniref:Transmembrane protein n=1 Tax=Aspergillus caelatus TaxID=61420 RepID=A0A5N7A0L9_9EURO|nr:uncharacterized protein BDV27DRAFT_131087 [Aspergillus caelatus]KAE8362729.1 hypothetical protein BDV27DRAFT_131087 [Aspergillus caelatus]